MTDGRERLISNLVLYGAKHLTLDDSIRESKEPGLVWRITSNDDISETCVQLLEFTLRAVRNSQCALGVTTQFAPFPVAEASG